MTLKKPENNSDFDVLEFMRSLSPVLNEKYECVTVADWTACWLLHYCNELKDSTKLEYQKTIHQHINRVLGNVMLNELSHEDVQLFINSLNMGVGIFKLLRQDFAVSIPLPTPAALCFQTSRCHAANIQKILPLAHCPVRSRRTGRLIVFFVLVVVLLCVAADFLNQLFLSVPFLCTKPVFLFFCEFVHKLTSFLVEVRCSAIFSKSCASVLYSKMGMPFLGVQSIAVPVSPHPTDSETHTCQVPLFYTAEGRSLFRVRNRECRTLYNEFRHSSRSEYRRIHSIPATVQLVPEHGTDAQSHTRALCRLSEVVSFFFSKWHSPSEKLLLVAT